MAYSIVNSDLLILLGMPTIGSEDCLQVLKHPQKCPSASEAASEDRKKKGVVYEEPGL